MHQRSLILDRGNPFSVPGGHSRARNRPILARAGILNAVHVLLQLLLQNFYFAAAVAITMAERNVDSDDGEFIATWCIQLRIYVHILLYFFPLLQNSSWNSTTFMGSTKQTFRRLLRTRRRASVARWRAALRLSRSLRLLRALTSSFWRFLYF